MTFKEYVEIFNSLLTPLIAVLAAYIAWQQYKVSHSSLNNQLYERRFKVFKAVMSYLADIMREGNTTTQRTSQFYAEASEAYFLFDEKISLKITELYEKGIDLAEIRNDLYPIDGSPGLPEGEERSRKAKASGDLMKWFYRQINETKELFKQHMQVK